MPRRSLTEDEDPLSKLIAPPPNESPAEREQRISEEKKAKEISDGIDEELNAQRLAEKKENKISVLLLGASTFAGKSTTLKNFQLINSPKAFKAERGSWRTIVQLNIARSIRIIFDAMTTAQQQYSGLSPVSPISEDRSPSPLEFEQELPMLTAEHLKLKMRLSPLLQVEESLWRRLSPSTATATQQVSVTNVPPPSSNLKKEIYVQSATPWKSAFSRFLSSSNRESVDSDDGIDFDDPQDPGVILNNCAEDMIKLWHDPTIKALLQALRIRLEDTPGFFLDELDRVTALKYVPSDDDILKARLKTMGVSEHRFVLKTGNMMSRDWRVFDVGGARSLRAAWAPFFDACDAIIFLAPLSCFDQSLVEDPSVNRLEDSILLWRAIVSNQLLQTTELILFLNKCDILKAKLESGIRFSKWVISYGDRPNTFEGTSRYMKKKFATIFKQHSTTPRTFYCHFTSVTDTHSTFTILENGTQNLAYKAPIDNWLVQ
ncbi:guanine nucleotide binding protein, alpha subunit [Rhodocollybia butyracea]|uniref:Guanine nucleotide binding protein, alpha subunit n=1 Tax=Rhodocollybia butyracea TaxID=206335 RepID=A0A9P5PRF8_9AGAR|nr:guanine nucleotide binding protein, alpha subunit [Rhodocollybia butyracea]